MAALRGLNLLLRAGLGDVDGLVSDAMLPFAALLSACVFNAGCEVCACPSLCEAGACVVRVDFDQGDGLPDKFASRNRVSAAVSPDVIDVSGTPAFRGGGSCWNVCGLSAAAVASSRRGGCNGLVRFCILRRQAGQIFVNKGYCTVGL